MANAVVEVVVVVVVLVVVAVAAFEVVPTVEVIVL